MKKAFLALAVAGLVASGVQAKDSGDDQVVATVNGVTLTSADANDYMRSQTGQRRPSNPNELVAELVSRELLRQEADSQGLEKSDEFKQELAAQKTNLLVNTLLSQHVEGLDLSDEAVEKEYKKQISETELTEYKARHILVKEESEAKDVIKALNDGGDFEAIAKEKSTGPSGPNGGDLGWFQATSMVPPFAEAVKTMEKGKYSEAAVHTDFGWHVILLENSRKREAPPFAEAKDRLKSMMANRAVQEYVKGLHDKAKVEFPDAEKTQ